MYRLYKYMPFLVLQFCLSSCVCVILSQGNTLLLLLLLFFVGLKLLELDLFPLPCKTKMFYCVEDGELVRGKM